MATTQVQLCTTSPAPVLQIIDGKVITTSLRVAEHFGKRHDNVLQAIRNIECSTEFRLLNFKETYQSVPGPNGGMRKEPYFNLTRDGFTFLAMGFTGKQAAQWKEAYITAFNSMESALQDKIKPEWNQARLQGKTARKSLTDAVQNFVEYAKAQGSQNAQRYYANITKMEYAALELTAKGQKIPKEFRDTLDTMDIGFLLAAEQVCKLVLDEGVRRGLPYKDIYALAKERVTAYAKAIAMPRLEC